MTINELIIIMVAFSFGVLISYLIFIKKKKASKSRATSIVENANKEAERIRKNASFKAKEEIQNAHNKIKQEQRQRDQEATQIEKRLVQQEVILKNKSAEYDEKENKLKEKETDLKEKTSMYENKLNELNDIIQKEMVQMENISQFSQEEAKEWVVEQVKRAARADAAQIAMDIKNEMKERANREAKDVLAKAIENMAYEYTVESTLSSIPIPNDRIKGMIIGREGKNIKAFEEITSVKLIIDETPETVVLSGFDPIKRDIAGRALKELIDNKLINPKEIERIWKRKKNEIEREMRKAAADCVRHLNIKNVSEEMFEMLGRLKYRTSYGQNILQHSIEVAKLAGYMAGELGLDVQLAKRAGLFHDVGKANSHDSDASHVAIGVEVASRASEHPVVINAILSHHEEAEPISPISVLVNAADKISGSRPGARRDSLEQYTQRINGLEKIASAHDGVNKVYALSAGRELRVIVEPKIMDDAEADMLSADIAKEIQETMEYPGHIKVTVIRQTVISSLTNNYSNGNSEDYSKNEDVERLEEEIERKEN